MLSFPTPVTRTETRVAFEALSILSTFLKRGWYEDGIQVVDGSYQILISLNSKRYGIELRPLGEDTYEVSRLIRHP